MSALIPAYFNWSGGKDSALALYYLQQEKQYAISHLLTTINEEHQRISMHGVRRTLLLAQAASLDLPLQELLLPSDLSMDSYNLKMSETLNDIKAKGVNHAVFGDIFLEDLKKYRDDKLSEAGFTGIYPLWKKDSRYLVEQFIDLGFKTITVCTNAQLLDKSFCGRIIDRDFLKDLPKNIDPAGENGEFHTFVFDGPIFNYPIPFEKGELVYRSYPSPNKNEQEMGFWFQDLLR